MQEPPQCAEAANREAAPQHRFLDMLSPAGYRYWMPATDIAQREGGWTYLVLFRANIIPSCLPN